MKILLFGRGGQVGWEHLIFRTSWVYAARGDNFANTMLKLAQERGVDVKVSPEAILSYG